MDYVIAFILGAAAVVAFLRLSKSAPAGSKVAKAREVLSGGGGGGNPNEPL